MKKLFRNLVFILATSPSLIACAAGDYPDKPVRIIVPYSAGGPVDIITRGLAARLTEVWKVTTLVDNKPGANEIIGASEVSRASPDGTTLLMATDAAFSQNQYLFAKLPYDPVDGFVPVTRMVTFNMVLFVPADFPATNVREFVAYVKSHPMKVSYGSAGAGGITHLAMADLQKREGLDMAHIPYKGLAPVIQDMLSGQIQAGFGAVSAVEPHIHAGKLKALAIAGSTRAKILPDVPTFAESGYAYVQAIVNVGLLAPRGTPPKVVDAIAAATRKVIGEPEFKARYIDSVAFEMIGSSPKEFEAFIGKDRPLQKRRIELSGARLN